MERDRDQATGDYVNGTDGKPTMTSGLGPACRTRLRGHRKGWMYAPDDTWGSDFYLYNRKQSVQFRDQLGESIARKALKPLEDNGRIDNLDVETEFSQRGGTALALTFFDRQKQVSAPLSVPIW